MIVCICHRVSDHDIARAVRGGCASFDELQHTLAVGTGCGACTDCAHRTFHEHAGSAPAGLASAACPASLVSRVVMHPRHAATASTSA